MRSPPFPWIKRRNCGPSKLLPFLYLTISKPISRKLNLWIFLISSLPPHPLPRLPSTRTWDYSKFLFFPPISTQLLRWSKNLARSLLYLKPSKPPVTSRIWTTLLSRPFCSFLTSPSPCLGCCVDRPPVGGLSPFPLLNGPALPMHLFS